MSKLLSFLAFVLIQSSSFGSILVYEFQPDDDTLWHGQEVAAVACVEEEVCPIRYTGSFFDDASDGSLYNQVNDSGIVNMSFSIFKPSYPDYDSMREDNSFEENLAKYEDALKEFETDKLALKELITNHPNKLFTIAAGNGVLMEIMMSPGVVVSEKNELYPSLFQFTNALKVAALNESMVNMKKLNGHSLANYSNYGLESVDIAAPVPLNSRGETQRGTSFAAPFIAKVANKIKKERPEFTPEEIKELLMKSVYVPALKKAIWASEDIKQNGKDSIVYKAQHASSYFLRLNLQSQLNGIMLVKSGGFIISELVENALTQLAHKKISIEEACLKAHQEVLKASDERLSLLKKLWDIRGF